MIDFEGKEIGVLLEEGTFDGVGINEPASVAHSSTFTVVPKLEDI